MKKYVIFKDTKPAPYVQGKTAGEMVDIEDLKSVVCSLIDIARNKGIPLDNFSITPTVTLGKVSMITLAAYASGE